jgi:hypothetical protein
VLAAPSAGARTLHTVLQDDGLSLFSPPTLPRFIGALRWLGVDQLRISAEWKIEAPAADSKARPRGFRASDPNAYRSPGMRALDSAVRVAASAGLGVIIDPAFSAPLWATSDRATKASPDAWYQTNIDARDAAMWEAMLARRYSGHFVPAGQRVPLPRVQTYTLWNEPNDGGYLGPQWRAGVPVSADWYRRLVELAYPAIKRVAPHATVLIGNTSAGGGDYQAGRRGVPPLQFVRRLACVDSRLRPLSGGACAHFHTSPADGYAHQYERTSPPWVASGAADSAQIGDLGKLQQLLDTLAAKHRLAPGAEHLWLTEQGYESDGQLTDRLWTEAQQAQFNAISEYLAWRDPRIVSFSQFLLRDMRTAGTLALRQRVGNARAVLAGTWTSGLVREDYRPKPALWMFRAPIVVRAVSCAPAPAAGRLQATPAMTPTERVEVWGRARPASARVEVQIQMRGTRAGDFYLLRRARTDRNGVFDLYITVPVVLSGELRFRWLEPGGRWQVSPGAQPIAFPALP